MEKTVPPEVLSTFYEFDKDGNGLIDPDELKKVLQKISKQDFDDDTIQALFVAADTNKDGKIDMDEFLAWMFDSDDAKKVREALNKERMSHMGARLLSVDLPWMKENVDMVQFNKAVLSLFRDHCLDYSVNSLSMAHALMSVDDSAVPQELTISGTSEPLSDESAAPLVFASLLVGCKSVKVQKATCGPRTTDALSHGLVSSDTEVLSLAELGIASEETVADILAGITTSSKLKTLDLSGNLIGVKGAEELQHAVGDCQTLKTVVLKGAKLGDDAQVAEFLQTVRSTLESREGALQM